MPTALFTAYLRQTFNFVQPNGSTLFPNNTNGTIDIKRDFTSGVSANKVDRASVQSYTIPAGETLTVDVSDGTYALSGGGSGTVIDANGVQVTFARLKVLYAQLVAGAGKSASVTVNGSASNVVTSWKAPLLSDGTSDVAASIVANTAAGYPVTNTTADKVVAVNNDGSNPATLILIIGGGAT